jgi:hypothetical protein
MHSYIRSLWVSVVCAVVVSGVPGVAVAHEANPSSGSSGTTPSLMAMIIPTSITSKVPSYGNGQPGAAPTIRAAACNSANQYAACISLAPSRGPAGAQVTVNGTGWIDHANRGLDVPINIGMAEVARAHPNADGTFRVGLTIPTSTPEGEVELDAIIGNGGSATAQYTVTGGGSPSDQQQTQPSVAFNPPEGPPGTPTTAHGHGFVPNQSVKVTQAGGPGVTGGGGTVQADQSGSIDMGFGIADKTPEGVLTVTFTQGANTATAQFRVTGSQTGQGTPGPTFVCGGEPCGRPRPSQDQLPNPPHWLTSPNAAACLISVGAIDLDASLKALAHVSGEEADLAKTKGLLDPNYWLVQVKAFGNSLTFPTCRAWIKELKAGK